MRDLTSLQTFALTYLAVNGQAVDIGPGATAAAIANAPKSYYAPTTVARSLNMLARLDPPLIKRVDHGGRHPVRYLATADGLAATGLEAGPWKGPPVDTSDDTPVQDPTHQEDTSA